MMRISPPRRQACRRGGFTVEHAISPNLVHQVKRKFIQRYGLEVTLETYEG